MFEQSFSSERFRSIIDVSSRKGVYLERRFFPDIARIDENIKRCIAEIRVQLRNSPKDQARLQTLNNRRRRLQSIREERLESALLDISNRAVSPEFKITLSPLGYIRGKLTYTIDETPESYFVVKRLQEIVGKMLDVRPANRSYIVKQLKCILADGFPKIILRSDIERFYESIDHDKLVDLLRRQNVLSNFSVRIITELLESYRDIAKTDVGVPRGVGISAYLAELYLKPIDDQIRALPGVSYYARYVDDIVVAFTKSEVEDRRQCERQVRCIVEEHGLKLESAKTKSLSLTSTCTATLNYLGYEFGISWKKNKGSAWTKLTKKKLEKYKRRLDLAFRAYKYSRRVDEKSGRRILVKRLRFLTGNTKLSNNKKFVFTGIYYSNRDLSCDRCLEGLDSYLRYKITKELPAQVQKRVSGCSFVTGFRQRTFHRFRTSDLSAIMRIWKYVE